MTTEIVSQLFDSRGGNFDDSPGLFDDVVLPNGLLGMSFSTSVSIVAWFPSADPLLQMSLATQVSITAQIVSTQELGLSLEGSAVESHKKTYGEVGTYTPKDPPAPAPYTRIVP